MTTLTLYTRAVQVTDPLPKLLPESRKDVDIFSTTDVLSCSQADGVMSEGCQFLQHISHQLKRR